MSQFKVITPDDIIQIKGKGDWYYKDRKLTPGEIDNLKNEAEIIQNMQLWKFLIIEGRYHAQKKALIDVKNYEELQEARALLNVTVLFEKFIRIIKVK